MAVHLQDSRDGEEDRLSLGTVTLHIFFLVLPTCPYLLNLDENFLLLSLTHVAVPLDIRGLSMFLCSCVVAFFNKPI